MGYPCTHRFALGAFTPEILLFALIFSDVVGWPRVFQLRHGTDRRIQWCPVILCAAAEDLCMRVFHRICFLWKLSSSSTRGISGHQACTRPLHFCFRLSANENQKRTDNLAVPPALSVRAGLCWQKPTRRSDSCLRATS